MARVNTLRIYIYIYIYILNIQFHSNLKKLTDLKSVKLIICIISNLTAYNY